MLAAMISSAKPKGCIKKGLNLCFRNATWKTE